MNVRKSAILILFLVFGISLTGWSQTDHPDSGEKPAVKPIGTRPMPRNPELFRLIGRQEKPETSAEPGQIQETRTMVRNPELFNLIEQEDISARSPEVLQVEEKSAYASTWRVLTLGFTATGYVGDLNFDDNSPQNITQFSLHPGLDLSFRRDAPKFLLPVFRVGYGKFSAQSDQTSPVSYPFDGGEVLITPNSYAESILIYGEAGLRLSLLPKSLLVKPYIEFGLGGQSFFPRAQDGILLFRKRSTRAPDEVEYPSFMAYFPLSAGFDFQFSTSLSLQLAYTYKILSSDYLDNIGNLGVKEGNDQLHVFRIGLGFRFADYKKGRKGLE